MAAVIKQIIVSTRITKSMAASLRRIAKAQDMTRSNFLAQIIGIEVDRHAFCCDAGKYASYPCPRITTDD